MDHGFCFSVKVRASQLLTSFLTGIVTGTEGVLLLFFAMYLHKINTVIGEALFLFFVGDRDDLINAVYLM